jgi:hypothetical protein
MKMKQLRFFVNPTEESFLCSLYYTNKLAFISSLVTYFLVITFAGQQYVILNRNV